MSYAVVHIDALDKDAAARRLAIAFQADPRTRAWAAQDHDLDGVPRPVEPRDDSP